MIPLHVSKTWNILNCGSITFTNPGTHLSDEPQFYQKVQNSLQSSSIEIMLIDDREENIEGAMAAGWKTFLWSKGKDIKDHSTLLKVQEFGILSY